MTNDQVQAIKQIATLHGFELYDIIETGVIPTLTGRYDKALVNVEEFAVIQTDLGALNCGLRFSALELMSIDNIPPGHSERFIKRLRKSHNNGQKWLKKAGF